MGNLTFLGDVADWWDHTAGAYMEIRDNVVHWVDDHTAGLAYSYNWPVQALIAGQNNGIRLLSSYVDVLRLGNGFRDGTPLGIAQDVLRTLTVLTSTGATVSRVSQVLSVVQRDGQVTCAWIAHVNAMRRAGQRFFVTLNQLFAESSVLEDSIQALGGTAPEWFGAILQGVRRLGVPIQRFQVSSGQWAEVENLVNSNPRGVFTVTFRESGVRNCHTLMAQANREGGVVFLDTNGFVYRGVNSLRSIYTGAVVATEYPLTFIRNSALVTASDAVAPALGGALAAQTYQRMAGSLALQIALLLNRDQSVSGDRLGARVPAVARRF